MVVAAAFLVSPVYAQRLSLAERVSHLEQQMAGPGAGSAVDMVNRNQALLEQVQSLQGQVEELQHQLQQMKQQNRDQYIDLDSRLGRLEGRAPGSGAAGAAAGPSGDTLQDIDLGNPAVASAGAQTTAPTAAASAGAVAGADLTETATEAEPAEALDAVVSDPAAEKEAYDAAFAALREGRYDESARKFQAFVQQYPDGKLVGNAYYWLGESYYVTQNYSLALQQFQTLLTRFPNGQKAPDALLKIGYCQYELKQWADAEATLNEVVQRYPDTTVSRLAEGRLRALKLEGHAS